MVEDSSLSGLPLPKVIFSDDFLMVFDKPAGLTVTSSETEKQSTLEDILRRDFNLSLERGGIVHRLDKDTSGLLVVGKTSEIVVALQAQFKDRSVFKEYLALVHGRVEESGRVEAAIMRNPGDREKFIVAKQLTDENARPAITEYKPMKHFEMSQEHLLEIFPDYSRIQLRKLSVSHYQLFTLVICHPLTGRTHQIRVHLKYAGHPIVGDSKYGGRKTTRLDHRWCPRQFLHAARLEFTHPITGKRLKFESELAADLKKTLSNLKNLN